VILQKMTDSIAHRGPDGEGHWIKDNVGIGHRRLAIIDLSPAAHQPMMTGEGRWILSYNGEIYNHRELRIELEAEGSRFRSNSDTEVVLEALAHWGTDALLKFNGMFALALWDTREKKLLLARDRYGIKPVYYSKQGQHFAFGSEQRAILATPWFERKLNLPALYEYFTFQNIFTDQTLMEDIQILPAGHFLILDTKTKQIKLSQYWDFDFQEPEGKVDEREYEEELRRLFTQGVNRQLLSDVEIGSYLSGGMDSGSIAAVASRSIPGMKTFTVGFDLSSVSGLEMAFDERSAAEAMSAVFGTEQYEMVLKAGDMERSLPIVVNAIEEPRVGQSYPNYFAAKLASKFVKVVLSGAAGDELFGGYPWRYFQVANSSSFDEYTSSYYSYWQRLLSNTELRAVFSPIADSVSAVWTQDIFRGVFQHRETNLHNQSDYINHSLYLEAKTFLHGLLVVEDKLSMANSVETRVPFLDNHLVDFAMRTPVSLKVGNIRNVNRPNENDLAEKHSSQLDINRNGKIILRNAMKGLIPEEIVEGRKQGFSSPDLTWFKGQSVDFVKKEILNTTAPIFEYMDHKIVSHLISQHLSGEKNRRLLIWSILSMNEWLRSNTT
jgi:asparagine synthase (glutamine-hydrolysing)